MRDQIINELAQMLRNNVGNVLSAELATGICTSLAHAWMTHEAAAQAVGNEEGKQASVQGSV